MINLPHSLIQFYQDAKQAQCSPLIFRQGDWVSIQIKKPDDFGTLALNFTDFEYTVHEGYINLKFLIDVSDSFHITLEHQSTKGVKTVYQSDIYKVSDNAQTELVKYWNNEDSFGFNYEGNTFYNQIRVPIELLSPKYKRTQKVYRKSNGVYVKTQALQEKTFEVRTEYVDEAFHDKLSVLTLHENIEIVEGRRKGKYVCEGEYDIEWSDMPLNINIAPANFKIMLSQYDVEAPLYMDEGRQEYYVKITAGNDITTIVEAIEDLYTQYNLDPLEIESIKLGDFPFTIKIPLIYSEANKVTESLKQKGAEAEVIHMLDYNDDDGGSDVDDDGGSDVNDDNDGSSGTDEDNG